MTPFDQFGFITFNNKVFVVEFNRLKRTPTREKVWPKTAISAIRCLIREDVSDDESCSKCGFGVAYRYKKDEPNEMLGMKLAFKRALESFESKDFRTEAWDTFFQVYGIEE